MTYSKEFLIKLSTQQHQTKYARITALDINDKPAETIEGAITGGGPISIDGTSAVRRSCNISIAAARDANVTNVYWALTNKFKVEIGLANNIDSSYPNIIWLNQGVYAITSFSISESATHLNVSISGRDKMVKLNGEMGGLFPVSTTLDTIQEVKKDGSVDYVKQPIYNIIRNMVHELGGEPWENIIINDLDAVGYELWDYRGVDEGTSKDEDGNTIYKDLPLYYFRDGNKQIKNMTIDGDKKIYGLEGKETLKDLSDDDNDFYIEGDISHLGESVKLEERSDRTYYIQKIEYGEVAGYYQTALVYPGDLVMNAGEAITAALDKIKQVLGEFEYFYDLDGRFIFQKKKTYVNNLFTPINGDVIEPFVEVGQYAYEFDNDELFTAISHAPQIANVKNDFIIWGNKRSLNDGDKLPVHARYAIDKRPTHYLSMPWYKKPINYTFLKATELYEFTTDSGYIVYYDPGIDENSTINFESYIIGNLPTEFSPDENANSPYILLAKPEEGTDFTLAKNIAGAMQNLYVKALNLDSKGNQTEYYRIATQEEEKDTTIMKYYL